MDVLDIPVREVCRRDACLLRTWRCWQGLIGLYGFVQKIDADYSLESADACLLNGADDFLEKTSSLIDWKVRSPVDFKFSSKLGWHGCFCRRGTPTWAVMKKCT